MIVLEQVLAISDTEKIIARISYDPTPEGIGVQRLFLGKELLPIVSNFETPHTSQRIIDSLSYNLGYVFLEGKASLELVKLIRNNLGFSQAITSASLNEDLPGFFFNYPAIKAFHKIGVSFKKRRDRAGSFNRISLTIGEAAPLLSISEGFSTLRILTPFELGLGEKTIFYFGKRIEQEHPVLGEVKFQEDPFPRLDYSHLTWMKRCNEREIKDPKEIFYAETDTILYEFKTRKSLYYEMKEGRFH